MNIFWQQEDWFFASFSLAQNLGHGVSAGGGTFSYPVRRPRRLPLRFLRQGVDPEFRIFDEFFYNMIFRQLCESPKFKVEGCNFPRSSLRPGHDATVTRGWMARPSWPVVCVDRASARVDSSPGGRRRGVYCTPVGGPGVWHGLRHLSVSTDCRRARASADDWGTHPQTLRWAGVDRFLTVIST